MTASLDGIELPDDLQWSDEYTAWKVGQVIRFGLTGIPIVQEAALQSGRAITLQSQDFGGGNYVAAVSLATYNALAAKEQVPTATPMVLVLPASGGGTRSFNVLWRRTDGPGLEARPIKFIVPAEPEDYFLITLRLIQV